MIGSPALPVPRTRRVARQATPPPATSYRDRLGRRIRSATSDDPVGATAMVAFALIVLAVLIGPMLPLPDEQLPSLVDRLKGPMTVGTSGETHLLGTDQLGRDVLARTLVGGRVSFLVASLTVLVSGTVGTLVGLVAGYRGGILDYVVMRLVDFQMALPSLLLAIFLLYIIGSSVPNLILLLSILSWYSYTRIVRSEVLGVKSSDYVDAARAMGASDARILFRHILPQVLPVLIVITVFDVSVVMLAEAGISFLGMGIQPPDTSWGRMIAEGQQFITTGSWWLFAAPGLAIFLTVLSLRLGSSWLEHVMKGHA